MTETTYDEAPPSILDRTIDLTRIGWVTIGALVVIVTGVALRFAQLDGFALSPAEGRRAFQAYSFYRGSTSGPGLELPDTGPAFLLLQSFALFLFGATDVVARIVPAILGSGIVVLAWMMSPFIGRARALGMAALAAISPTILYASRTADPQIAVAFFTLLLVVAVLRVGLDGTSVDARRTWSLVAGVALAAMFASGPASISVLICLAVGVIAGLTVDTGRDGALRRSINGLTATPQALFFALGGFVITLVVLFTRLFSDFTALSGIGNTFADWGRLLATTSSTTPTQFFLLAILLYEPLAIAFAIVAANRGTGDRPGLLTWPFFIGWFTAALLVFSFSSGRAPEQAIHVALPLVLIGGAGLGDLFASLDLGPFARNRTGALFAAMVGFVVAVIALIVLIDRTGDPNIGDENRAIFQSVAVAMLAVVPLAFAVWALTRSEMSVGAGRQAGYVALAVLALFLGGYTIRSSILLSYFNADEGTELLAQRTSTKAVNALVARLENLSRDATVTDGSTRDPTGGHGLSIAIDRRVQHPYRWYFRDFPDAEVVADGRTPEQGAQVVIAPDDAGMAEAGYTPRTYPTLNRVPAVYTAPDIGTVLRNIFVPREWSEAMDFLILRELEVEAPPETIAVGLNAELANRVFPNTGPFSLNDRPGAGSGRGQFNEPRGIAVAPDTGTIYVVDMGNTRVERFDPLGQFIGSWSAAEGGLQLANSSNGGPTGITVGAEGQLIYVCDTWNHRVVVLDQTGRMVREFGAHADNNDDVDPGVNPGLFYGPRDIAVTDDEIYVVDTGNERVQVFSLDGTFRRAFGGTGSEPGQLLEPVGIAIGADDRIYVADSGNARISVFAADGTPLEQWAVDAWRTYKYFEPYLAFDDEGNLYATTSLGGSIEVFDPTGQWIDSITQIGSEALEAPIGITRDLDSTILITDSQRNAVLRYAPPLPSLVPDPGEIIDELPQASPQAATPEATPEAIGEASPVASPIASPAASPQASPVAGTPTG